MSTKNLFFAFSVGCALGVAPVRAIGPDMPAGTVTPSVPSAPAPPPPTGVPVPPADSTLPTANFAPSRYEVLWTKSPFAVATNEDTVQASPDYILYGIANVDGIFYASVMERQAPQDHFLISSDKEVRGMSLKSINRSQDGQDTFASVMKDGQPLTLKLEVAPPAAGGPNIGPGMQTLNMPQPPNSPGVGVPQMIAPGNPSMPNAASVRPFFNRIHRPNINLPPRLQPQQQIPPPPTSAAPPPPK